VQIKAFRDGVQDTPAFKPFYEVEVPTGLNAVPKRFLVSVETGGGTFSPATWGCFPRKVLPALGLLLSTARRLGIFVGSQSYTYAPSE
jgi:hypothetical protein